MLTFNDLLFKDEKQKQTAEKWRNALNNDIITAFTGVCFNCLKFGYYWDYIKNNKACQQAIEILGIINAKRIYHNAKYNIYEEQ